MSPAREGTCTVSQNVLSGLTVPIVDLDCISSESEGRANPMGTGWHIRNVTMETCNISHIVDRVVNDPHAHSHTHTHTCTEILRHIRWYKRILVLKPLWKKFSRAFKAGIFFTFLYENTCTPWILAVEVIYIIWHHLKEVVSIVVMKMAINKMLLIIYGVLAILTNSTVWLYNRLLMSASFYTKFMWTAPGLRNGLFIFIIQLVRDIIPIWCSWTIDKCVKLDF